MVDSYKELKRLYKGVVLSESSATNGPYSIRIPLVEELWKKYKNKGAKSGQIEISTKREG